MKNIQLPDGEYITDPDVRVLQLIFEGHSATVVAPMLSMKVQAVRDVVNGVQRKLHTQNTIQTMRRLQELGLLAQITGEHHDAVNPSNKK